MAGSQGANQLSRQRLRQASACRPGDLMFDIVLRLPEPGSPQIAAAPALAFLKDASERQIDR
jgi:hypothetical protein